jgi:hypothetical protein
MLMGHLLTMAAPKNVLQTLFKAIREPLYGKFYANGNFEKWGISQDASTRYSAKELAGGRIKEYRRGLRDHMLDRERRLVERFPGPKNNEPWAGSRRPN